MDKMREEFEAYCKKRWPKHPLTFKYDLSYVDDSIEDAWLVWQASRAALVVEIRQSSRVGDSDYGRGLVDGSAIYKIYVEGQLDKAGIKWTD